jgi:hypothetical protein
MKRMDYSVEGSGAARKFTAMSERAMERTPEPVTFTDVPSALEYMKAAQAEGYRFSGANLVDREQRLVRNGYFVIANDGQLIPSGQDWGPLNTVYEVGDALRGGPRNGKEAMVEQIITGDAAQRMGFGLVFVLRERDVSRAN